MSAMYFEDFEVGATFSTAARTITEADVVSFAGVSGDFNPIHVHPLSARLFGFPRAIAHGMWTQARCLSGLAPRLPDAFSVEVAFRKPILLPAGVTFASGGGDAGMRFGVRDQRHGTPHLDGRVSFE